MANRKKSTFVIKHPKTTKNTQVYRRRVCRTMLTEYGDDEAHRVSTRRVCRTMLTGYVGDKAHTGFYTPCLSYNTDKVYW